MSLTAILLVVAIGALIGAVGLGGFLMVPLLALMEGTSVRQGIVVAAIAFLAAGVSLTSYHTFKICSPSRASTLTGRYPFNAGEAGAGGLRRRVRVRMRVSTPLPPRRAQASTT